MGSATYSILLQVATPTFNPMPGSYASAQSVTLSTSTSGASIYYTTNGGAPSIYSTPYSGPISVTANQTIRAIAVKSGMSDSAGAWGSYSIITTPSNVSAIGSDSTVTITWDAVAGVTGYSIYWNTTGSPTTASSKISVSSNSYQHGALANGTTYYYRVASVVNSSETSLSSTVSAVPAASPYTTQPYTLTMSSTYSDSCSTNTAASLYDGNLGNGAGTSAGVQYIRADLGSAKTIARIRISPLESASCGWGPSYSDGRPIQYSNDGVTWTTYTTISGTIDGQYKDYFPNINARYWQVSSPSSWLGLGEFVLQTIGYSSSSFRFDASDLMIAANSGLTVGGDFTYEKWIKYDSWQTYWSVFLESAGLSCMARSVTNMNWECYIANGSTLTATSTANNDAWTHVAYVRQGGAVKLYINGVAEASGLSTGSIDFASGDRGGTMAGYATIIGRAGPPYYPAGDNYSRENVFTLAISNVARYTSNFTPSKALQKDSNTLLYLIMPDAPATAAVIDIGPQNISIINHNITRSADTP